MRKYTLKEIQEKPANLDFKAEIEESGLPKLEINFTGSLESMDDALILSGNLGFSYETGCHVCSKQFAGSGERILNIFLTTSLEEHDEGEGSLTNGKASRSGEEIFVDLDTDDIDCYKVDEDNIDIFEIIKEELILDLPMRFLCSAECSLEEEREDSIKPFTALNDLLNKGEKNAKS